MKTTLPLVLVLSLLTLPALAQDAPKAAPEATTASPNSQVQAKTQLQSKAGASPTASATPQRNQLRKQLHDGTSPTCRLNQTSSKSAVAKRGQKQQKIGRGNGICDGSGRQANAASQGRCRHKGRNR